MSDPITAIAIGGTVLGGVSSAVGSAKAGKAAAQQARYQANIAVQNRDIALSNAAEAESQGAIAVEKTRREARTLAGRQRATLAALGQDVNRGSAALILGDTADTAATDVERIQRQAWREALGFRTQADQFLTEAQMLRSGAKSSITGGYLGAAGSLLGTAGSVAMKFK